MTNEEVLEQLTNEQVKEIAGDLIALRDATQVALEKDQAAPEVYPVARQIVTRLISCPEIFIIDPNQSQPSFKLPSHISESATATLS